MCNVSQGRLPQENEEFYGRLSFEGWSLYILHVTSHQNMLSINLLRNNEIFLIASSSFGLNKRAKITFDVEA